MARIYAGSDGSFYSGWQFWKKTNHGSGTIVLTYEDTHVYRTAAETEGDEYVWYVPIQESELPEGVEMGDRCIQDEREE